jgi:hypothetical protein
VHPVGLGCDRVADAGHTRGVGHRQVVAIGDRHTRQHFDLPAVVHEKGAVEHLENLAAVDALGRSSDGLDMGLVTAVDDDVLLEDRTPYVEAADGGDVAAGLADSGGETAEGTGPVVEPDTKADRVRSGRGSHGRETVAAPAAVRATLVHDNPPC